MWSKWHVVSGREYVGDRPGRPTAHLVLSRSIPGYPDELPPFWVAASVGLWGVSYCGQREGNKPGFTLLLLVAAVALLASPRRGDRPHDELKHDGAFDHGASALRNSQRRAKQARAKGTGSGGLLTGSGWWVCPF